MSGWEKSSEGILGARADGWSRRVRLVSSVLELRVEESEGNGRGRGRGVDLFSASTGERLLRLWHDNETIS